MTDRLALSNAIEAAAGIERAKAEHIATVIMDVVRSMVIKRGIDDVVQSQHRIEATLTKLLARLPEPHP